VNDARDRGPALITDWVGTFFSRPCQLGLAWDKLRRNRVPVIGRIDQLRHVLRNSDGELLGHSSDLSESTRLGQPRWNEIF
jgi:hypothetical protein